MLELWLLRNTVGPAGKDNLQDSISSDASGEVYVLNDGGETDLDLGNYERYLNVSLGKDNNVTTGKVYQHVIEKEVSHGISKEQMVGTDHSATRRLPRKDCPDCPSPNQCGPGLD